MKLADGFDWEKAHEAVVEGIRRELEGLRCPAHGESPKVTWPLYGELEIRGCCNRLVAAAHGRLGGKAA
jgi:hypothetical protein